VARCDANPVNYVLMYIKLACLPTDSDEEAFNGLYSFRGAKI
jgi:hypothetical protein